MRKLWPLAALASVALIGAGCSDEPADNGSISTSADTSSTGGKAEATDRDKAVEFAECMRDNGVGEFPDPDASGELTIDAVVNGSSIDTDGAVWKEAIAACKDLQPSGFTGKGKRSKGEQDEALAFAQCIRDNGVKDFPDPVNGAPLVDTTRIPSLSGENADLSVLNAAMRKCGDIIRDQVGPE
jgi:hypothetical protein